MAQAGFWHDADSARRIAQRCTTLKERVQSWEELMEGQEEADIMLQLALEENDGEILSEVSEQLDVLGQRIEEFEIAALLNNEYDGKNAIVSIHPGAGGTESQDWAEMLMRMYTRWSEKHGFTVETLDLLAGEGAGIKSATFLVKGKNAFGYLRSEKGVHRLVRISPFDSSGRRHTSFASVDVLPEVGDDVEVEVNPADLKIDTYRASGAGGQHVNKTDSAVRITHKPTGIVVQCQNERSQHSNRDAAMKILRAKLLELQVEEQEEELDAIRGEQKEIAWGNQIRSYVFCPYTMVKDHRTDVETGNVEVVMDGDIDRFINAYLRSENNNHKRD